MSNALINFGEEISPSCQESLGENEEGEEYCRKCGLFKTHICNDLQLIHEFINDLTTKLKKHLLSILEFTSFYYQTQNERILMIQCYPSIYAMNHTPNLILFPASAAYKANFAFTKDEKTNQQIKQHVETYLPNEEIVVLIQLDSDLTEQDLETEQEDEEEEEKDEKEEQKYEGEDKEMVRQESFVKVFYLNVKSLSHISN
jgi:hypothetical protein